jgi:hypothetical protein
LKQSVVVSSSVDADAKSKTSRKQEKRADQRITEFRLVAELEQNPPSSDFAGKTFSDALIKQQVGLK